MNTGGVYFNHDQDDTYESTSSVHSVEDDDTPVDDTPVDTLVDDTQVDDTPVDDTQVDDIQVDAAFEEIASLNDEVNKLKEQVEKIPTLEKQVMDLQGLVNDLKSRFDLLEKVSTETSRQVNDLQTNSNED